MNRRSLFKGLMGVAGGLILPPTLEENAEASKKIWALGRWSEPKGEIIYTPASAIAVDPMFYFDAMSAMMSAIYEGNLSFAYEDVELYRIDREGRTASPDYQRMLRQVKITMDDRIIHTNGLILDA